MNSDLWQKLFGLLINQTAPSLPSEMEGQIYTVYYSWWHCFDMKIPFGKWKNKYVKHSLCVTAFSGYKEAKI